MTRHHAHAGNHLVMALAGLVAVVCAAVVWTGMVLLIGGMR
jgi:hypothetical protein